MMPPKKIKTGFVILFAVLLVSIVLTISLSIFNITLKQLLLSLTVRESQYAFYAADSLKDCLVYWQKHHLQICRTGADSFPQCAGSNQSAFGFDLDQTVCSGDPVVCSTTWSFNSNDLQEIKCGGDESIPLAPAAMLGGEDGLSSYIELERSNASGRNDCARAKVDVWLDNTIERFLIVSAGSNQACDSTNLQKLVNRIIYRSYPQVP